MLEVPRWILATVVIAFATFHAVIGALAWEGYDNHFLLVLSIVLYLASIGVSVSMQDGQINRVKASFNGNNRAVRYAS